MQLNPHAAEFCPQSKSGLREPWQSKYTGWGKYGNLQRQSTPEHSMSDAAECTGANLLSLPDELINEIVEKLRDPQDLLALSLASKKLQQIQVQRRGSIQISSLKPCAQAKFLLSLPSLFKGLESLDLSGCDQLAVSPIACATRQLPALKYLDLTECRKLDDAGLYQLLNAMYAPDDPNNPKERFWVCKLQFLSLQKCYRLKCPALDNVLQFTAHPGSSLRTAILSLLGLEDWPSAGDQSPTASISRFPAACRVMTSSLKILALNNCWHLAADNLTYLAACCPDLEALFLGGCSIDIPLPRPDELLEATEEDEQTRSQESYFTQNRRNREMRLASILIEAFSGLTALRYLELTFVPPQAVKIAAEALHEITVWDFTEASCLENACRMLDGMRDTKNCMYSDYKLTLSAAVNCYSFSKQTPLHAAVQSDCLQAALLAVQLGASLEIKDTSGATPLFMACENGKQKLVRFLVRAGANLGTCNRSGEAPLYIAALRGNVEIVQDLLTAFEDRQIAWVDEKYGDGWNPLMAAAVTTHPTANAIAIKLLRAAGPRAGQLAAASNKYGQTTAHVAARKGNHVLLKHLLKAAGNTLAVKQDDASVTPLDIATAHRCDTARILLADAKENIQATVGRQSQRSRFRKGPLPYTQFLPGYHDHPVTVQH